MLFVLAGQKAYVQCHECPERPTGESNTGTCLNAKFSWPAGAAHRKDVIIQVLIDWVRTRCMESAEIMKDNKSGAMDWNEQGFYSLCEPDGRLEPDVGQRITHVKFNPTGQIDALPEYITVRVGEGWCIEAGL
jgi:hypothetical protein